MGTTKAQTRDCVSFNRRTWAPSKMGEAAPTERLSPKHPDWLWLQSPAEMLMAERSAPFDPKTDCWIADPDEVYIRGKITKAGDTCEVQTAKGTENIPKAEVLDCNPPKWLMVYTPIMRAHFRNRRRTDAPPHLYAVADGALQLLEMEGKHQSSLITGESGAGKTENTKKVLQYYA